MAASSQGSTWQIDSIQICLATLAQYFNTNLQILSLCSSCNSMRLSHLSKGATHAASACNAKPQGARGRRRESERGKAPLPHMNSLPLPYRKCVFPTLCCRFCAFIMHVVVRTPEFGFRTKGELDARARACGLGFSIKLFCGCSDNQTIVQYILLQPFPRNSYAHLPERLFTFAIYLTFAYL